MQQLGKRELDAGEIRTGNKGTGEQLGIYSESSLNVAKIPPNLTYRCGILADSFKVDSLYMAALERYHGACAKELNNAIYPLTRVARVYGQLKRKQLVWNKFACKGECKMNMKKFVEERDEALLSLDKQKILAYAKKYGVPLPSNENAFWAGIHKARLQINGLSDVEKEKSRQWLEENNFKEGAGSKGVTGGNPTQSIIIEGLFSDGKEMKKGKATARFTSDDIGETLSLAFGETQITVPFEPVQGLIDRVRGNK